MSTATKKDPVADALRETLVSPNVCDSNLEPANIVDVVDRLARFHYEIFDKVGGEIQGRLGDIASAINNLADAIRESKERNHVSDSRTQPE